MWMLRISWGYWGHHQMSRQILLCVETNKRSRTDYMYINAAIKRFYKDDKKIKYCPIFLGTKTKYNAKEKVGEINECIKRYPGKTTVIYFIDVDDYEINSATKSLFDDIVNYCAYNQYDFVFFTNDVEDVFLGCQISDSEKVKMAEAFTRKKQIENVLEANLRSDIRRKHCSNILNVLDKYWTRKP